MKDRPRNEHSGMRRSHTSHATETVERRSAKRKPFIAETQVVELRSGAKLFARSCDLVIQGCYVDTLNPFPAGTSVHIRLKKQDTTVEARGKVAYQIPGMGMGISFCDLTPQNYAALEKWLFRIDVEDAAFEVASLPADQIEDHERAQQIPSGQFGELIQMLTRAQQQPQSGQLVELIQMLTRKGILTGTEAASLLQQRIK